MHSGTPGLGENLYAVTTAGGPAPSTPGADAVESWAEEAADYNYGPNTCDPGKVCGHYTQVVWADTTHVGCGYAVCSSATSPFDPPYDVYTWYFVVCQYDPPGNWIGEWPY
jgi:hypothetical protein